MKRQERQQRKAKRKERQLAKAARLAEKYVDEADINIPKIQFIPEDEKKPKQEASLENLDVPKQVKTQKTGSRYGLQMTWCARSADTEGRWSWGESRLWDDDEWDNTILCGLSNFEGEYWQNLQNQSSDSGHLMHHDHDVDDLCDEAIERWLELGYEQFDTVFRFRLGNLKRVWGVVLGAHFFMIWWDARHKIYPV